MNEAERCDRISLMHAGRVLASDTPSALQRTRDAATLEETFIAYLEEAAGSAEHEDEAEEVESVATGPVVEHATRPRGGFRLSRLLGVARREAQELWRDPIRLTIALFGSALLMVLLGYGITFDVDELRFAVLDRDQTPQSRDYVQNIAGSRYFLARPALHDQDELDRRMRSAS